MKLEEIKIGIPVIYWSVIKENGERFGPKETVITSDAWQLGHGEVVCMAFLGEALAKYKPDVKVHITNGDHSHLEN